MCNSHRQGRYLGLRCSPHTRSEGALTGSLPPASPLGVPAASSPAAAALDAAAGGAAETLGRSVALGSSCSAPGRPCVPPERPLGEGLRHIARPPWPDPREGRCSEERRLSNCLDLAGEVGQSQTEANSAWCLPLFPLFGRETSSS